MRIEVSPKEYAAARLDDSSVEAAVEALDADGYVILGSVIEGNTLDALKRKLDADTAELLRRLGTAQVPAHLSQPMPCSKEHIHRQVVANPLVIQVTSAVLGDGVHNHFYNCNTNMPGSGMQALHRDAPHAWRDPIHPIVSIIVNVSPVDVDESNGATELWPATHKTLGSTIVTKRAEEDRRASAPPVRAVSLKGDAVLRDPRLWHRGVPNLSSEPRHMVAMVHSKWFYESETSIPVTRDALHAFDHDVLATKVEIVPDDHDYLAGFLNL
jgi:ectoine hydroxylase-related dioxygenase (phytanoyl-CoA dioxygenase family)